MFRFNLMFLYEHEKEGLYVIAHVASVSCSVPNVRKLSQSDDEKHVI